jgi:hypothetical protein
MKFLIISFSAALVWVSWGQETNVVFSDDFETPSPKNPPANWAMWGAEEFKIPANFPVSVAGNEADCTIPPQANVFVTLAGSQ